MWSGNNTLDERFGRPQKDVGTVLVNGKRDLGLIAAATSNKTSYYPLADGQYRTDMSVQRGDLIFTYHDNTSAIECINTNPSYLRSEVNVVKGIAHLNGQGNNTMDNHELMLKMQIHGIVEMGTDENRKEVFNILTGGIHTVRNNSPWTIRVGDRVMAYAPSMNEVRKGNAAGRNTPEEKAGVIKLWYKPYDPSIHKNQLKQIYNCLSDTTDEKPYLPQFRTHCRQFLDSIFGMSMTVIAKLLPTLRNVLASNKADEHVLVSLLQKMGHSEFPIDNISAADEKLREDVLKSLFVLFSSNDRHASPYLFNVDSNTSMVNKKARLNHIQQKSTSQHLESTATFYNFVKSMMVGQAKSTAAPGKDFSLQQNVYT